MPAKERPEQQTHLASGESAKYINHALEVSKWDKPNMKDPEAVKERVIGYFETCAKNDMKPSVAGMALAFGVSRQTLLRWRTGDPTVQKLPAESKKYLEWGCQILNAQMEDYMQNGKINPVAGIFLMKNNMNYRDETEVTLKPGQTVEETSAEDLKKKYIDAASLETYEDGE